MGQEIPACGAVLGELKISRAAVVTDCARAHKNFWGCSKLRQRFSEKASADCPAFEKLVLLRVRPSTRANVLPRKVNRCVRIFKFCRFDFLFASIPKSFVRRACSIPHESNHLMLS